MKKCVKLCKAEMLLIIEPDQGRVTHTHQAMVDLMITLAAV